MHSVSNAILLVLNKNNVHKSESILQNPNKQSSRWTLLIHWEVLMAFLYFSCQAGHLNSCSVQLDRIDAFLLKLFYFPYFYNIERRKVAGSFIEHSFMAGSFRFRL